MLTSRNLGPWARGLRPRARDLMVSYFLLPPPPPRSRPPSILVFIFPVKLRETGNVLADHPRGLFTVTLVLNDNDFAQLTVGKANAQQLFMKGKLKIKGNMMAASKLEPLLKKISPAKAKL